MSGRYWSLAAGLMVGLTEAAPVGEAIVPATGVGWAGVGPWASTPAARATEQIEAINSIFIVSFEHEMRVGGVLDSKF